MVLRRNLFNKFVKFRYFEPQI